MKIVMRWEEKHRPRKFDQVRGQPRAVKILSGLAAKKSHKHSLLLRGAVGSGKTTLVRMYAQALNCQNQDADGSPCQQCENCTDTAAYLKEYNSPLLSAEAGRIQAILRDEARPLDDGKVKVLFFDEAQGLSKFDQQLMLKVVENPPARAVFCFATTDLHLLSPALRSRLFEIEIKSIETTVAVEMLEDIAKLERVPYDYNAFLLLTAAVPPQARDLTKKLEELAALGRYIDVPFVKEVCGLSVCDSLSAYAVALAEADRQQQTAAFTEWRQAVPDKLRLLQRFLLTVYYNDIVGQRVVIDPLCSSMNDERMAFVLALCERTRKTNPRELASVIESWLDFWAGVELKDESALMLRLVLFEKLANAYSTISTAPPASAAPASAQIQPAAISQNICDAWELYAEAVDCRFVEREHVREVVNRASALTQLSGTYFNALVRIESAVRAANTDGEILEQALLCASHTMRALGDDKGCSGIFIVERVGSGIVAHLGAHIPGLIAAAGERNHRKAEQMQTQAGSFAAQTNLFAGHDGGQFHWDAVRALCAGFDGDEEASPELRIRSILGIPPRSRRTAAPFDAPRLAFIGGLTSAAIAGACENGLLPLSAFDAKAWSKITMDWEPKEFVDRREEVKRRAAMLLQSDTRHGSDQLAAERARVELRQQWASLPPGSWARTWNKDW